MSRQQLRLAAAAAAVVVVCGLIPSKVASGGVPRGFQPADFTATSDRDWWLLGTVSCGRQQCLSIARTRDGGRRFSAVHAPPSWAAKRATVAQLRFANARDGYAFGPELWSTHDGGRSWRQLLIGYTDALAAADGYVYALVSGGGPDRLMRSPIGRDRWHTLGGPLSAVSGLWVQGRTVIVQAGSRALVSADRGRQFRRGGRLPAGSSCDFDTTDESTVIWAMCGQARAGGCCALIRSTSAGARWAELGTNGVAHGPPQAFAAASASVAVVADYQRLYRTIDGGAAWSQVSGLPRSFYVSDLAFMNATDGVAIGGIGGRRHRREALYETTDGGASYRPVRIG